MSRRSHEPRAATASRVRLLLGAAALVLLAACAPTPASDRGDAIKTAYEITFVFAAVIFAVVTGMIVWASLRFRRKPGDDTLPRQTHGNTTVEIIWTVIQSIIVLVLFIVSATTLNKVDAATPGMNITVTGFQWQWTFTYQDIKDSNGTPLSVTGRSGNPPIEPVLGLQIDRPVTFHLESADVIHSFYIPVFLFKRDVVPGLHNQFSLTPNRLGTFDGKCAELCGLLHSEMLFQVQIMTKDRFDAWTQQELKRQEAEANQCLKPADGQVKLVAKNIAFDAKCIEVPATQPFTIDFDNQDAGIQHNVDVFQDAAFTQHVAGANGPADVITGPKTATYDINGLQAGTYYFKCDIHPGMNGQLKVS